MNQPEEDAISRIEVSREVKVHGERWRLMYGGYFSSQESARPLLETVREVIRRAKPMVVADLGGGTGFIIKALADSIGNSSVHRWVDIDLSEQQLAQVADDRITAVSGSMVEFNRSLLALENESVLYLTRSTFHYVGSAGQKTLLEHIRSQMKPGEYFIPQVAAFEDERDALCISELFERMNTGKWLIPLDVLKRLVRDTGFELEAVRPAPMLVMGSDEMAYRYDVAPEIMMNIFQDLLRCYEYPRFLTAHDNGFTATLDYYILVCRAV